MTESTYDQLQKLAADFWTWRAANQPISSDDIPRIERPDDWVPDWSRDAIQRRRTELTEFTKRHDRIDASSWEVKPPFNNPTVGISRFLATGTRRGSSSALRQSGNCQTSGYKYPATGANQCEGPDTRQK